MCRSMDKILAPQNKWILLFILLNCCNSIIGHSEGYENIKEQTHIVTTDESEPIVLDCVVLDTLEQNNSTLVVKWLKDEKPIYQWIKGRKPTVYPPSKGLIDEEFIFSTVPNYKHRAISFPVPTKELSGIYTCLVETMNSTKTMQIKLQVIDVSQVNIDLQYESLSNESHVTCSVENVYPEPKLAIWVNDDDSLLRISENQISQQDGFFNVTVVVSTNLIDGDDEVGCSLNFPGVNFNKTMILRSSASIIKATAIGLLMTLILAIST